MTREQDRGMAAIGFEGRRHKRRLFGAAACITSADGSLSVPCAIVDISNGGARVNLEHPDRVPEEFILVLSASGSVRRRCRAAWRSRTQIGIRFL
jgi:hypothetical protein